MISIIIPVLNEEQNLQILLPWLNEKISDNDEIIVCDGKSTDRTVEIADMHRCQVVKSDVASRAIQMNLGAEAAKGKILYFVHADTIPPSSFVNDFHNTFHNGFDAGCFRFKFNSKRRLLKINSYFTRFNKLWCRGGDQSLFIKRELWDLIGGFNEKFEIMEDFEYLERLNAQANFKIVPKDILVSDRKYDDNSYFKVQIANLIAFLLYKRGYSQSKLKRFYKNMLGLNYLR